ncbi:MAG: hypothetical protein EKK55_07375 [Rhodocyclaceae bacterium]|nr:MAG: hypothetical protein EKK55_07375 [Rhodocyclaceae bacterium]
MKWPEEWPHIRSLPIADWLTWAYQTFVDATAVSCCRHLAEEVAELQQALISGDIEAIDEEAADVVALALHTALRAAGHRLPVAMLRKMKVNALRRWATSSLGYAKHVDTPSTGEPVDWPPAQPLDAEVGWCKPVVVARGPGVTVTVRGASPPCGCPPAQRELGCEACNFTGLMPGSAAP